MDSVLIKTLIQDIGSGRLSLEDLLKNYQGTEEGLFVKSWVQPKTYLDGDLIKEVNSYKNGSGEIGESIDIDFNEILILLEAFRGQQYQGFLRHLIHSFCSPNTQVFPVRSKDYGNTCCICGKPLLFWKEWRDSCALLPDALKSSELKYRNHLALGSEGTNTCICTNCLIHLKQFQSILDSIDPGILNYQKSTPGGLKA